MALVSNHMIASVLASANTSSWGMPTLILAGHPQIIRQMSLEVVTVIIVRGIGSGGNNV